MNLKTAALRLGVHYQTAYRWVRSGQLVAVKVGSGYEVSEAAVARLLAQRAAIGREPDDTESGAPIALLAEADIATGRDGALQLLDVMVEAVTLDAAAISARAARFAADHLGDTAYLYERHGDEVVVAYAAHRDPVSEVAAVALGRDPRTPTSLVRRALGSGETVFVPHVPQRELRRRVHPEFHEHLHLCGCYSALCAPVGVTGALLVTRDVPGRPYTTDDLTFVEELATRIACAEERARAFSAAWRVRREMVEQFESHNTAAGCFDAIVESIAAESAASPETPHDVAAQPALAVLDLALEHVAANKAYAALFGDDPSRLEGVALRDVVRDAGALDDALAPVLAGEIDYRSVELEVGTDAARVALHLAMVRREDATPRGIAVVAHPVPPLTAG